MGQMNSSPTDKFYYGYRQVIVQNETAQPTYARQPLQPADFLDPREGDHFEQGPQHDGDVDKLVRILHYHHRHNQYVLVQSHLKLCWPELALPEPRADVAVLVTSADATVPASRPRCIIEVTAPRFVAADLEQKPTIYARAGIAEYIIVDANQRTREEAGAYRILGYRLVDGAYQPIEPDERGRIHSAVNRVWIGPNAVGTDFVVTDARTGRPLAPAATIEQDRPAQTQGERRAQELGSALDFLRNR